jgi:hypothetical protein
MGNDLMISRKYTDETRRTRSWIKQLGHVSWPKLFVWDSGFHKMTEGITLFIMFEKNKTIQNLRFVWLFLAILNA